MAPRMRGRAERCMPGAERGQALTQQLSPPTPRPCRGHSWSAAGWRARASGRASPVFGRGFSLGPPPPPLWGLGGLGVGPRACTPALTRPRSARPPSPVFGRGSCTRRTRFAHARLHLARSRERGQGVRAHPAPPSAPGTPPCLRLRAPCTRTAHPHVRRERWEGNGEPDAPSLRSASLVPRPGWGSGGGRGPVVSMEE
jgi:hypothetical protein